jgi:hypothetical protein
MALSKAAQRKLGNLADHADRTIAEMIRERGGTAANVRHTGSWAEKTLAETSEAAVQGDLSAASAIKIVKQARRLGEKQ